MVRSFTGQYNFPLSGVFAGDNPGASFGIDGAILTSTPTEYAPPAQPYLGPVMQDTQASDVPEISYY
jgi:hypothetical protein